SDMNGPIWRGGKFVTAITCRPSNSGLLYHGCTAAEDLLIPNGPKSTCSLYEGFRASGKSCTSTIIPTRISTFCKSVIAIIGASGGARQEVARLDAVGQTARDP